MTCTPRVARASLHQWEEPPISGSNGSGALFFSGCPMGCVYCQNKPISHGGVGHDVSVPSLAKSMMNLQKAGAHNLNLVTATHFLPSVLPAIDLARQMGFALPVVYNTSGYETVDTLKYLEGYVDIYLTDMRYMTAQTAEALSSAPDYPSVAKLALAEMVRQTGKAQYDANGIMQKGTIVRFLLLPGHLIEAKMALRHVAKTYGEGVVYSLMCQYTPTDHLPPPLHRTVTEQEYHSFVSAAQDLGITTAFVQDRASAKEDYIPPFLESDLLSLDR